MIRLFLLGETVERSQAQAGLAPLPLEVAATAGLVEISGDSVRALLDIRPYAQDSAVMLPGTGSSEARAWWVVSDFGTDVRDGPLAADHVLGIGSASLTLAQATPRTQIGRALDVGTGCGIQALHLSEHASSVTASDISARALAMAATTAALSGHSWDLRAGSLLKPVVGERFDLIVANPPFVLSSGDGGYDYRDSGLAGDRLCRDLVRSLPDALSEQGTAQLLANWAVPADGTWRERLALWFEGSGCDTWVWQREVAEPGEYVSMWLRDAGEVPGTSRWTVRYDAWLDWFESAGIVAVGMGLITMWRSELTAPALVIEDVPQAVEQPAGSHITEWVTRQRALALLEDTTLLDTVFCAAPGVVLDRADLLETSVGWRTVTRRLRQSYAMRWEVETDDAIAALVAGCDGTSPLRAPIDVLAAALGAAPAEVAEAAIPVVRDLVARGFLLPAAVFAPTVAAGSVAAPESPGAP